MLVIKKNCAVCTAIKTDKKLLQRIFNSSWYIPHSSDSLRKIAGDCTGVFSYESLKNHVKKHQFINSEDYTKKMTQLAAKRAESQVIAKHIESPVIWNKLMAVGIEKLEAGDMEVKAADLLKAAKDKSDYQFKKSDQQLQLMETIAHFASAENLNERVHDRRIIEGRPIRHVTDQPTADVADWQDQSGSFYQRLAGGAAAPGPS